MEKRYTLWVFVFREESVLEKESVRKPGGSKKIIIGISIVAVLLIAGIVLFLVLKRESYRSVVVNDYHGDVELNRADGKNFEVAEDMKLIPGDQVETGKKSDIDLLVDDDKHIYGKEKTKFSIEALGTPEDGKVTIELKSGQTLIEIEEKLSDDDTFRVKTPNATVSVRGTTFSVRYDKDLLTTTVDVLEGVVEVKADSGDSVNLNAGESATVTDVGLTTSNLSSAQLQTIFGEFIEDIDLGQYGDGTSLDVSLNVGDYYTFGRYDDRDISWIVIAREGNEAVLLSQYSLLEMAYSEGRVITWEQSSVRSYLNHEFYKEAFTEEEQSYIVTNLLTNEDNPVFGDGGAWQTIIKGGEEYPAGGRDTEDKVYLLSLAEIEKYFGISPTDFANTDFGLGGSQSYEAYINACSAKTNGVLAASDVYGEMSDWWLRSPGSTANGASMVLSDGSVFLYSGGSTICDISNPNGGVRPVIRVSVNDSMNATYQDIVGTTTGTVSAPEGTTSSKTYASYVEAYNAVLDDCVNWINSNTSFSIAEENVREIHYGLYDFNIDGTIEMGIYLTDASEEVGKWGGDNLVLFILGYDENKGEAVCYDYQSTGMYIYSGYEGKLFMSYVTNGNGMQYVNEAVVNEDGIGDFEEIWSGKFGTNPTTYSFDGNFYSTLIDDRSQF